MSGTRPDKSNLYYPRMPANWWLKKRSYLLFMLRELSSVFIALFLVAYLLQVYKVAGGPEVHNAFVQRLAAPGWVLFHVIVFLFAIYHSLTWFESSAVVLPVRVGDRVLPRSWIFALHVAAWIVASAAIWFLLLRSRA